MSNFEYDDGNVEVVILGGTNKKTGQKNPTDLTGYYLRKASIETKFGVKPFYVFQTKKGQQGLIGGGNLNKIMETKAVGLLTHVVDTGTTRDVGKGNPMKVFKVGQDKNDSIDTSYASTPQAVGLADEGSGDEEHDFGYDGGDEETQDETPPPRPQKAAAPAALPTGKGRADVQALLNRQRRA
jgi:hypothetical protein